MEIEYTDQEGVKHDLQIFKATYNKQSYYRILRDGIYFIDITRREDGTWEELFNGPSERSEEYGGWLEKM
jgi:hypothetical protein